MKNLITVIIIAKNEEAMIAEAIESAWWADVVLVIDDNSMDKTAKIAKKAGARVILAPEQTAFQYARLRNYSLKLVKSDWIFYLDADERITEGLKNEIEKLREIKKLRNYNAYAIPRYNYYLGQRVRFGGAYPDYVKRLFYRQALKKWVGYLHEEPVFEGGMGHLKKPIEHYTHRDLTLMMKKTIEWSKLEAEELYKVGHPPMVWWRFLRIMFTELWNRGIKQQGFRDGTVGVIEVIFQMYSRFITYARLWELQQRNKKS